MCHCVRCVIRVTDTFKVDKIGGTCSTRRIYDQRVQTVFEKLKNTTWEILYVKNGSQRKMMWSCLSGMAGCCEHGDEHSGSIEWGEFITSWKIICNSRPCHVSWVTKCHQDREGNCEFGEKHLGFLKSGIFWLTWRLLASQERSITCSYTMLQDLWLRGLLWRWWWTLEIHQRLGISWLVRRLSATRERRCCINL